MRFRERRKRAAEMRQFFANMARANRLFQEAADKACQRLEEERAERITYSVDDGIADHGRRYGGTGTIHNTGTVDIVMEGGVVTEVWFRCMQLAFKVATPKGTEVYGGDGARLVAVEVEG